MIPFLLPGLALVAGYLVVRKAKADDKSKKRKPKTPSEGAPPEPTQPGSGVIWAHAYYTIGVEKADSPGEPPFSWGVFDTRGLRSIATRSVSRDGKIIAYDPEAFAEAQQAGYEYGFGTADTYAEAVAEAQLWAETIREPLAPGETISTIVDGNLVVVSPQAPALPYQKPVRWIGYVFDARNWPNWAAGQLPGPSQMGWSITTKTQDEALGQAVLYARRNPPGELGIGAGMPPTSSSGVQLRWTGAPGSSSLIAVGQHHGRAHAAGSRLRVGQAMHSRARLFGGAGPRTPTRQRAVRRLLAPGAAPLNYRPFAPRWPGDTVLWFHEGSVIALERGDTPGESEFTWAVFDTAILRAAGWSVRVATERGGRRGYGFAAKFRVAAAAAEAFARRLRLRPGGAQAYTMRGHQ